MKFSAQTAEQAIEKGLQELGKTREEVEIVIVSEGKKGKRKYFQSGRFGE